MFHGHLLSSQAEIRSLTGMVKRFNRLCSPYYLKSELKTLQNTFFSRGYPRNLVSKVITRARSSAALKMIGSQNCSIYLKVWYLGKISEMFSKKISEKTRFSALFV